MIGAILGGATYGDNVSLDSDTTIAGKGFGMPRVLPFEAGMANLHTWGLLVMVVVAVATGYGRERG